MKKFLAMLAGVFAFNFAFAAVDLNTASVEQLQSVKGIGPAKAKAIAEYRQKNGPFKTVDELEKVPGFGAKSVSNMKAELSAGAAAAAAAKPAAAAKAAAASVTPATPAPAKK